MTGDTQDQRLADAVEDLTEAIWSVHGPGVAESLTQWMTWGQCAAIAETAAAHLVGALVARSVRDDLTLRERIEALRDQRDVLYPDRFKFGAAENFVAGYRAAQADLAAVLTEHAPADDPTRQAGGA